MRVLICIDDEICIENLKTIFTEDTIGEDVIVESYLRTSQLLRFQQISSYDVALLGGDIQGESGFGLGRDLHEINPDCLLMYVCEDYSALHETFRSYGFQILLKSELIAFQEDFQRMLTHYIHQHYQIEFYLDSGKTRRFLPGEIYYLENGRFTTTLVTAHQRFQGHFASLSKAKILMLKYGFFQMHPRYFVNMEHILLIKNGELQMRNGDCIPTSVMNKELIDDALQSFIAPF